MKHSSFLVMTWFITALLVSSCKSTSVPTGSSTMNEQTTVTTAVPSPPCIVYKTKGDFNKYVPVILSSDKTKVISYPDVKDIYYKGEFAYPTELSKGYLLDNRGIGPDVAFLNYTYEAYSKLPKTPTATELYNQLLNKDPLTEMYDCGSRAAFADPVKELNALIESGALEDSKRLK